MMETYHGHVRSPQDAIILFEACRIGLLPRVQRRLSEKERAQIRSGSVFVWDEREAGMRRWTDGRSWSASRVSGSFLTYREMQCRRSNGVDKSTNRDGAPDNDEDGPDYRYKPDGLMKQSFSITTSTNQHLHLISYFSRAGTNHLMQPTQDPQLRGVRPEKGLYPDSTVSDNHIPAVTRGPMNSPGYTHAPNQPAPYSRGGPQSYYHQSWAPPSPMHTPPPHGSYPQSYYQHQHPGYGHYPPPPYTGSPHASHYDRPPPGANGHPPPSQPYPHSGPPPPQHGAYGHHYPPPPPQHHYPSGYPHYPPPPQSHSAPYPPAAYDSRPPHESRPAPESRPPQDSRPPPPAAAEQKRPDSHQDPIRRSPKSESGPLPPKNELAPLPPKSELAPPAVQTTTTAQTIPSISAMLNGGGGISPPIRNASRSPGGTPVRAPLQDIPSHKLGFEVVRDVQALRTLDKTTFKGY